MSSTIQTIVSSNLLFLEIELKGQIDLNSLILNAFKSSATDTKILKASIEYFGKKSFGKIIVQVTQNQDQNLALLEFLKIKKIKYSYINLN